MSCVTEMDRILSEVMKRSGNFQTLCYNCHSDIHGWGYGKN